jgi:hypothetical protein
MARRLWKNQFAFYVLIFSGPLILFGLAVALFPDQIVEYCFQGAREPEPVRRFFMRFGGGAITLLGFLMFGARKSPSQSRELFFWMGALYIGGAALFGAGPFFYQLSWWTAVPAVLIGLFGGAFLWAFASRNLLVRE